MALSKITYNNKVAMEVQPSIADINKIQDSDLNSIKTVVNAACDQVDLNTGNIDASDERVAHLETVKTIIDIVRPVGSLYISANATNPNTMWPGTTWIAITDTFIVAAGSTYTAGTSYGASTHTHSGPSHTHTINAHSHTSAAHSHTSAAHSHTNSSTGSTALTTAQIPSHSHIQRWCGNDSNANTYVTSSTSGVDGDTAAGVRYNAQSAWTTAYIVRVTYTGGGSGHTHTMSNTGSTTPGATGSTTPGNVGSTSLTTNAAGTGTTGQASSIPPCIAKYVWQGTA